MGDINNPPFVPPPPPFSGASVTRAAFQLIPTAAATAVIFTQVDLDNGGYFDPLLPAGLTIPEDGFYLATAGGTWPAGGAGNVRHLTLTCNDGTFFNEVAQVRSAPVALGVGFDIQECALLFPAAAGSRVVLTVSQDSGGNVGFDLPRITITRLGPYPV